MITLLPFPSSPLILSALQPTSCCTLQLQLKHFHSNEVWLQKHLKGEEVKSGKQLWKGREILRIWFLMSYFIDLHILIMFHYLSEMMWLCSLKLENFHWEKGCHIWWCYIYAVVFEACRLTSLYQLVCIWVSLEFPCTDKEACLAAKLLKYNFLTQWVLVFFDVWSGGASFNAVNRRLLSRGFFYLTFDWSFQAEL